MRIKEALLLLPSALEARILLSHVTGFAQEYLIGHLEEELKDSDLISYFDVVKRRKNNEPIAYITGKKEFYGRDFKVMQDVLIPRNDTETLIDAILKSNFNAKNILDLGVGSGCIICTLLLEMPQSKGLAIDISDKALNIARLNLELYELASRCDLLQSNWFENVSGKFDVIVSNPPYIEEFERNIMSLETLEYEPESALFGGLSHYKEISEFAPAYLSDGGRIYLEIGPFQALEVEKIFESRGFVLAEKHLDIEKRDRVLVFELDYKK